MNIFDLFYISVGVLGTIAISVVMGHWMAYAIVRLFRLNRLDKLDNKK